MNALLLIALAAGAGSADAPPFASLEAAVKECRRVVVAEIPEGERPAKRKRIEEAAAALQAAGPRGAAAVEAEIARMRAAGEKDVFFQQIAAETVLAVRESDGLPAALEILRDVNADRFMGYLWSSLTAAAASRDPRGLPLLRLALATGEGSRPVFFVMHAMTVPWPYFVRMLYQTYGPDACSDLQEVAARPGDARTAISAAWAIGALRCHGAAPILREWVTSSDEARAGTALATLGALGDPADRGLLASCVARKELEVRQRCAYALVELGDPLSTGALRALLRDPDEGVRREALFGLLRIPTAESAAEILAAIEAAPPKVAGDFRTRLANLAKWNGLDAAALQRGDPEAWRALERLERERSNTVLLPKPDDRAMTRDEFLRTLAAWEEKGRVEGASKQAVLAVAVPADIPAIQRALGRVLLRQSDECMDEVEMLDDIIRVLDRRRMGWKYPNL